MRNNVKIDYSAKAIVATKSFLEEANIYGTEEYRYLKNIRQECPDFEVVPRSVRTGNRNSNNKGLTYQYMRKFISIMDSENLLTFEKVILHYEGCGFSRATVWNYVKDWFLENYPNHKDMIVDSCPKRVTANFPQAA